MRVPKDKEIYVKGRVYRPGDDAPDGLVKPVEETKKPTPKKKETDK